MKGFIRGLIGGLSVILLGAVFILFLLWSRAPDMLASALSKKLRVSVEVGDIDFSMEAIAIEKLEIGNPPRFHLSRAFSADSIVAKAPVTRYFKDAIVIDQIDVDRIYLGLEFDSPSGTEGNWTTIMANAQSAQNRSSKGSKSKKTVFIKRIVFTNINTDLVYRNQGKKVRHLPTIDRIELENISSEGGNAMDQIMNSALGEMLKQVFIEQNLKEALDKLFNPSQSNPLNTLKQLKGLFNAQVKDEPHLTS